MRKLKFPLSILVIFILTACSAHPDSAERYAKLEPLNIDIVAPNPIKVNETSHVELVFEEGKDNKEKDIELLVWKEEHKQHADSLPISIDPDGNYYIDYIFETEGIYYIKANITVGDKRIMPTKQIRVGNITKQDKNIEDEKKHENHHKNGDHH